MLGRTPLGEGMDSEPHIEIAAAETYLVETILKEISDIVSFLDDAQQVMERLVGLATALLNVDICSLVMIDPRTEEMRIRAAHGLGEHVVRRFRQRLGEGISGHVAKTGKPLLIEDVETHPLFRRKSRSRYRTKSLLSVPLIQNKRVVGVLNVNNRKDGGVFTRSDELLLSVLANFVVIAIDKAELREKLIRTERYEAELRVAREIQERSLLGELPQQAGWDFAVRNVPAHAVGGDFFDALILPGDRTCIALGDVCGKGVPAALYMARVLAYFRVVAKIRDTAGEIMSFVNDLLAAEWTEHTFVTATLCIPHRESGKLSFCSAGHTNPYLRHAGTTDVDAVPVGEGLPLGIEAGMPYESTQIDMSPGDVVVMCTDGVIEAADPKGELFGEDRLKRVIARHDGPAEGLVNEIVSNVRAFAEGRPQADDVTLVVVRRTR